MEPENDIDETVEPASVEAPQVEASDSGDESDLSLRDIIKNAAAGKDSGPIGETASEKADRLRDEKGRFLAGDKSLAAPKTQTDITAQGEIATPETPAETPGAPGVPRSWAAEDGPDFLALPPATQSRIAEKESKREAIFNQKTQELSEAVALNRGIGPVIQPYIQDWKFRGVDPAAAVSQLLSFDEGMRNDPEGTIRWLAAENQVDLRQLAATAGQHQNAPQQPVRDERVDQLESRLLDTENRFQQQEHQRTVGFVTSWGGEKDQGGNALRPHFDTVREEMALFVPALEQKYPQATQHELLERAYRLALADRPDLQKIVAQSAEQKRIADQKAKADRAAKASVSIPSSFNGNTQAVSDNLRDVIVAAVNQHRA